MRLATIWAQFQAGNQVLVQRVLHGIALVIQRIRGQALPRCIYQNIDSVIGIHRCGNQIGQCQPFAQIACKENGAVRGARQGAKLCFQAGFIPVCQNHIRALIDEMAGDCQPHAICRACYNGGFACDGKTHGPIPDGGCG
jgi:hypothetical protein